MKSLGAPCSTGAISKNSSFIPEPGIGFFAVASLPRKDSLDRAWTQGLDSSCKWRCGAGGGYVGGDGCMCWKGKEGQSLTLQPCRLHHLLGDGGAACGPAPPLLAPEAVTMADRQCSLVFQQCFFLNGRHNPEFLLKLTK